MKGSLEVGLDWETLHRWIRGDLRTVNAMEDEAWGRKTKGGEAWRMEGGRITCGVTKRM